MFGAQTENVAFTANCTHALNMAIKGVMQYGGHMIISDHEHNAVARPVYALSKTRGVKYSIARTGETDSETVENFRRLITPETKCICCTVASNVTGRLMPYALDAAVAEAAGHEDAVASAEYLLYIIARDRLAVNPLNVDTRAIDVSGVATNL